MANKNKKNQMALLEDQKDLNIRRQVSRMVTCAFCQGKGVDPFDILSPLSKCQACLGRCKIEIEVPLN